MQENHYRLLDVPFTASRKDITTAYRKAMRKWHPDHFRGTDKELAEEYAKRLNNAYSVLSDPHKREEYDRSIRVEAIQGQIMEKYVAGYGGWNVGGSGPLPADAPRRSMSARERRELRISDRNAFRSMIVSFAMLLVLGLLLLAIFSLLESAFSLFS
jgi:DnaJ-class molecular chaperone